MLNSGRGLFALVGAAAAVQLVACESYCPKGYDKRGDTCYRIRDSGVEGGLSDAEAASEVPDGDGEHALEDGAIAGDASPSDDAGDDGMRACADAADSADCSASETRDACEPGPCEHGGTCLKTGEGVQCDCAGTGYEGATCEVDIDECASPNSCTSPDYPCVQTDPPGYFCQGQFAEWPMPDAISGAKVKPSYAVTASPEMVIDQVTTLMWQRYLPATYAGCTGSDAQAGDSCSWEEAKAYCRELLLAGFDDWRLPSKIELESIAHDARSSPPAFDSVVFPDVPPDLSGGFWSSTRAATDVTVAAVTVLSNGGSSAAAVEWRDGFRVRCVRGPHVASGTPAVRYQVEGRGPGSVTDTRTGLMWQQNIDAENRTRSGAIDYCSGLGTGWRLPTKKEFLTLVDPVRLLDARVAQADGAIDLQTFPSTPPRVKFWSISSRPIRESGEPRYWRVDAASGLPVPSSDSELARVRCVR